MLVDGLMVIGKVTSQVWKKNHWSEAIGQKVTISKSENLVFLKFDDHACSDIVYRSFMKRF